MGAPVAPGRRAPARRAGTGRGTKPPPAGKVAGTQLPSRTVAIACLPMDERVAADSTAAMNV